MLNVERLRALHAVAAQGSVLAAADTLHVTTSAVSQQLAKLEREVGRPLLEKQGRGVRLTDAGRRLVAHAEQVLSMLVRAEAELEATRDVIGGRLSIAAFATSMRGLAPQALVALRARYPQLQPALLQPERVPQAPAPWRLQPVWVARRVQRQPVLASGRERVWPQRLVLVPELAAAPPVLAPVRARVLVLRPLWVRVSVQAWAQAFRPLSQALLP